MDSGAKTYWLDRIGLGLVLLLFFSLATFLIEDKYARWSFVLVVTTAISFTHFFVGWFYQLKSFQRAEDKKQKYSWFLILSAATIVSAVLFFINGQILTFFLLVVAYFMIHGYFNEFTLYKNTTGRTGDKWLIASTTAVLTGLIFVSLDHPSSLINAQFEYYIRNDFFAQIYIKDLLLPAIGFKLAIGCFIFAALVQVAALLVEMKRKWYWLMLCAVLLIGYLSFYVFDLNYIFVIASILLYHFLIWFLQYFKRFKAMGTKPLSQYMLIHALVLTPFVFILLGGAVKEWIFGTILNAHFTLTLTATHVTTSFMSENWFRKLIQKINI